MPTAPNVTVIPAKVRMAENRDKYHQLRVAAYCRVSTEQEEQQNSFAGSGRLLYRPYQRKRNGPLQAYSQMKYQRNSDKRKNQEFNRMIRMCRNKKLIL